MCVIVAVKVLDDVSGEKRWIVGKNRDRNYIPDIYFRKASKMRKYGYSVFVDKQTGWSEGINKHGIAIVNTALMVKKDEKEGKKVDPKIKKVIKSLDGPIIRKALQFNNIYKVVDYITKEGLYGFSFVTDGVKMFVIENDRTWVPDDDNPEEKKVIKHDMTWYEVTDKKIEYLVRTNHGDLHVESGYPEGSESGDSSRMRRKYVEDEVKRIKPKSVADVFEVLSYDKDKNPNFNPIRKYGKCEMFTTGQVVINPSTKTMYYRPIKSNVIIGGKAVDPENIKPREGETNVYVISDPSEINESMLTFKNYLNRQPLII